MPFTFSENLEKRYIKVLFFQNFILRRTPEHPLPTLHTSCLFLIVFIVSFVLLVLFVLFVAACFCMPCLDVADFWTFCLFVWFSVFSKK